MRRILSVLAIFVGSMTMVALAAASPAGADVTQDQTSNQNSAGTQNQTCIGGNPCDQDQTATQNQSRGQLATCTLPDPEACDQNQTANQSESISQTEQSGQTTEADQDQTTTQNQQVNQLQSCDAGACDQDQNLFQSEDDGAQFDQTQIQG